MAIFRNFYARQSVFALLHAACVFLGLAPFDIWPCAFLGTFFVFFAAHEQADVSLRKMIFSGLVFALALTAIPFVWIIATIHRYTGESAALTFVLTLFYAVLFQSKPFFFFFLRRLLLKPAESSLTSAFAFAALLALVDAVSPELFVWSWGNTLAGEPHLRQWAAVASVYGVSFIACFGGWYLFRLLVLSRSEKFSRRMRLALPEFVIILCFLTAGVALRYFPSADSARKLHALVIQTNIGAAPEAKRSDAAFATDAINRLFNQSLEGLIVRPETQLVVWPEAAMPFHAAQKSPENAAIYSPSLDGVLEFFARAAGTAVLYQHMTYNGENLFSEMTARPGGGASYYKRRLVPWGEYLPLESAWPGLRKIFRDAGRFSTGHNGDEFGIFLREGRAALPGREALSADLAILDKPAEIARRYAGVARPVPLMVKPLLCYEALFPSDARTQSADIIVNLASDAWFGDGIEGWQHAGAASLRAVENGIPMLRAAMSGVSYAVDYRGDFTGSPTGQARPETLAVEIPLAKRRTVFARFGITAFYLLMFAALWPYAVQQFRSFRIRENK